MKPEIAIIEPETPENIGAIARSLANFGHASFRILNPKCDILSENSRRTAKHAQSVLEKARVFKDWETMTKGYDTIIGTTGKKTSSYSQHRTPIKPSEITQKKLGKTLIIFGRESTGLTNQELKKCDLITSIPTSKKYPVMNLSHAVTIIAYETSKSKTQDKVDRKGAITTFSRLVDNTNSIKQKARIKKAFKNILLKSSAEQEDMNMIAGAFKKCN